MNRADLTKEMRWSIAKELAKDRLPTVNRHCEEVIPRDGFYVRYGKRMIDIVISIIALLITLPLNIIFFVVTLIDVGRPVFFHQERLGRNGKLFQIIKFRNMRDIVDSRGELLPPSERVTKFGKLMRKTSFDELLNFLSILKGDMSMIGPRPLVPEYLERYNKRHYMRMAVRPGLECPPHEDLDHVWTWQEQFENDVWYVQNVSLKTDIHMSWQLVKFALNRKSSNARASAARGTFMGYSLDGTAINLSQVPQEYIDACEDASKDGDTFQMGA